MTERTKAPEECELLYQVDETPPIGLTLGLGLQMALLCVCSIVINPTIIYRTADQPAESVAWAVFVSLLIAGVVTMLHACPTRRIGAGYLLVASTTAGAIAVSVDALSAGGQGLLLTLMVTSAILQLVFSWRISAFRQILTPTVTGTMLMLIPVDDRTNQLGETNGGAARAPRLERSRLRARNLGCDGAHRLQGGTAAASLGTRHRDRRGRSARRHTGSVRHRWGPGSQLDWDADPRMAYGQTRLRTGILGTPARIRDGVDGIRGAHHERHSSHTGRIVENATSPGPARRAKNHRGRRGRECAGRNRRRRLQRDANINHRAHTSDRSRIAPLGRRHCGQLRRTRVHAEDHRAGGCAAGTDRCGVPHSRDLRSVRDRHENHHSAGTRLPTNADHRALVLDRGRV